MSPTGHAPFDEAVAAYLEERFSDHPISASFLGLTEFDHQVSDLSAEAFARRERADESWLDRFNAFDLALLSDDQQIDLALLQASIGAHLATAGFAGWRRNVRLYLGNGVFELFAHGNRSEAEATAAALSRLAHIPETLSAARANMSAELADPLLTSEWAVPNVEAQVAFMEHGLGDFVTDAGLAAQLQAAGAEAATHYAAFAQWMRQLAERASGSFAYGEEYYDATLRIGEGFEFGARELREMGRQEMERLEGEMSTLAQRMTGDADWRALAATLRGDHPASMGEMLATYRAETIRAREFIAAHGIVPLPADESCAVEPGPLFLRAAVPVASYFPPAYFGPATPGTFNVPFTPDGAAPEQQEGRLRSNAYFEVPAITAHEAYPGHHLHFAAAKETNVLRQVLTSAYMIEGWGLYTEQMMGEQGFYLSDAARFGQLGTRLFRAGRMVVDPSLHLVEMSIDEATTFMAERCGLPQPTARGEVLRYCMSPTQACAYLTGALEIERMARRWTASGRGTLAAFHQALVTSGKLPLGVATRAIGLDAA